MLVAVVLLGVGGGAWWWFKIRYDGPTAATLAIGKVEPQGERPDAPRGYTRAEVDALAKQIEKAMDRAVNEYAIGADPTVPAKRTLEVFDPRVSAQVQDVFPDFFKPGAWQQAVATTFAEGTSVEGKPRILARQWTAVNKDGQLQVALHAIAAYDLTEPRRGVIVVDRTFKLKDADPSRNNSDSFPGVNFAFEAINASFCEYALEGTFSAQKMLSKKEIKTIAKAVSAKTQDASDEDEKDYFEARDKCRS